MPNLQPSLLALSLLCCSLPALAEPAAPAPQPLLNAQSQSQQWSGIGRLSLDNRRECIASLIDSRTGAAQSDGPAYLVTAGHCVDRRNGIIAGEQPITGNIAFNYFVDTPQARKTFTLKQRIWSSMQGTDLALLELDVTLAEVMASGVTPLPFAPPGPAPSAVQAIFATSAADAGLRSAECRAQATAVAIEYPWVWRNVQQNDCPGIDEGASGSPVLDSEQRLVAVINSVVSATSAECGLNTPCLFDSGTPVAGVSSNVAMPVQRIRGCFAEGRADLTLEHCQLLPGFQAEIQRRVKPTLKLASADGTLPAPGWDTLFSIDTPRYRYKTVRDPLDCEVPTGYSGTVAAQENHIDEPIGNTPGWYFLCLIGVESPEQLPSPALMANSLSLPVQLLPAASVPAPDVSIEPLANGNVQVTWTPHPPDLVRYWVKRGAVASTDCADPAGYRRARHAVYEFKATQLPLKLCSRGEDINAVQSEVRSDILQSSQR
ncbi:trypsin-like serine peptidase [Pseudomonas shirazensis]|uniref:trypsin-like serine peptidase n=1 Tax=Pseudomonas shirazensis TaxID=2745494 RepID=UPI003D27E324